MNKSISQDLKEKAEALRGYAIDAIILTLDAARQQYPQWENFCLDIGYTRYVNSAFNTDETACDVNGFLRKDDNWLTNEGEQVRDLAFVDAIALLDLLETEPLFRYPEMNRDNWEGKTDEELMENTGTPIQLT